MQLPDRLFPPKRTNIEPEASEAGTCPRVAIARWLYWSRTIRPDDGIEGAFGEPSWDMLLYLYFREGMGKRVTLPALCDASNMPMTSAWRYVQALVGGGWIEREDADRDGRIYVSMSKDAIARLNKYLDRVAQTLSEITPKVR